MSTSDSGAQWSSSALARAAVDAPVQELDVLRLARQHVDQVEALQVHVLQRRELLAEHHGRRRAVAVEQRELRRAARARASS